MTPYYSPSELIAFERNGNVFHAAHTVLISRQVQLGSDNVFYPNVVLTCTTDASISIGSRNRLYPNFFGEASGEASSIEIADDTEIGPGLVVVRANMTGSRIRIGSRSRILGQVEIFGKTVVGAGAQVLGGTTTLINVTLSAGEDYSHPDYDARGAVAKGAQTIKNMTVPTGMSALPPPTDGDAPNVISQRMIHTGASR